MQRPLRKKKRDIGGIVLTVLFSLVCILYVMPIVEVLINSFKTHSAINTDTFALPNAGRQLLTKFPPFLRGSPILRTSHLTYGETHRVPRLTVRGGNFQRSYFLPARSWRCDVR